MKSKTDEQVQVMSKGGGFGFVGYFVCLWVFSIVCVWHLSLATAGSIIYANTEELLPYNIFCQFNKSTARRDGPETILYN